MTTKLCRAFDAIVFFPERHNPRWQNTYLVASPTQLNAYLHSSQNCNFEMGSGKHVSCIMIFDKFCHMVILLERSLTAVLTCNHYCHPGPDKIVLI